MPYLIRLTSLTLVLIAALLSSNVCAETALVAVATNFADAARRLEADFEASAGHGIIITTGSTGKLYAQIVNGAPFDVLLAADQQRPRLLEESGHAVEGTRITYGTGRLSLWSPEPSRIDTDGRVTLQRNQFRALAIANPALAPYGLAARQTLQALGLWDALENKIVMGENVGQTQALIATGNAELGFVARSQLVGSGQLDLGSRWDVPAMLHAQIRQDAVLLRHGADNPAARAFLAFLSAPAARASIRAAGYDVD